MASACSNELLDIATIKSLVQLAGENADGVSLHSVHKALYYLERNQQSVTLQSAVNAHGMGKSGDMIGVKDVLQPLGTKLADSGKLPGFIPTKTTTTVRDLIIAGFESGNRAVALVGPKGCFKSAVARDAAQVRGVKAELFSLYSDMTARDLLQVRSTDSVSGDTIWRETPLTRAARNGTCLILDGVDKLRSDTLSSIALLLEQGWAVLPDGTRFRAHEKFRCIAIGHPPTERSWITPEVKSMFHWIQVDPLPTDELRDVLKELYPSLQPDVLHKILKLQKQLNRVTADSVAEKEALQLSMRKMKHICRRVEVRPDALTSLVNNTLMSDFLPDRDQAIVRKCLRKSGIDATDEDHEDTISDYTLDEALLASCRRIASNPLLVPNPSFQENPGQAKIMGDILEAHSVGEKALLISGYQGVGKNLLVDHLLSRMNCEREYIQLHRDSTIQSLLLTPSVENGKILYHDSPLVRAATLGRLLVVDEADKAPTEVVSMLKGLIEDRQLALPDGRMLCHDGDDSDSNIVTIHPSFSIWTLTNPVGFPFHGNDLAREMADVFSCHNVPPMDMESHRRILSSYGAKVDVDVIDKIVKVWEDLRVAHKSGAIAYPFSVRESVGVVKHMNEFPDDGIEASVENVIAFDRLDNGLVKHLSVIFSSHGISVLSESTSTTRREMTRTVGSVSTPKTRSSSPNHGRVDPDNTPHVGGNTWAGGTGGSDTAGLGGRGGPYRLDSGHPVHQVSDEMKAEVSEEARKRAREMAKDALEKKLKELEMGKRDWKRYSELRERVEESISVLKSHLKHLKKQSEERVWLKKQSTGELDENRIVDLLAGEKDVFKRRGKPGDANNNSVQAEPINIRLVVDISASMYRFNSYDGRLERLLEATLMMMECLRDDKRSVECSHTSQYLPTNVVFCSHLSLSSQIQTLHHRPQWFICQATACETCNEVG